MSIQDNVPHYATSPLFGWPSSAVATYSEVPMTATWAAAALGELPGALQLVGMAIVGGATFTLAAKKAGITTLGGLAAALGGSARWLLGGGGGGGGGGSGGGSGGRGVALGRLGGVGGVGGVDGGKEEEEEEEELLVEVSQGGR